MARKTSSLMRDIRIDDLPPRLTERDLLRIFSDYGSVHRVIIKDRTAVVTVDTATAGKLVDSSGIGEIRMADGTVMGISSPRGGVEL